MLTLFILRLSGTPQSWEKRPSPLFSVPFEVVMP